MSFVSRKTCGNPVESSKEAKQSSAEVNAHGAYDEGTQLAIIPIPKGNLIYKTDREYKLSM